MKNTDYTDEKHRLHRKTANYTKERFLRKFCILGEKGFTLLEMVITLAILAIVLTLGFVKFGEMSTKTKINTAKANMQALRSAIRQLVSDRGASTSCMEFLGYGREQFGRKTYRWELELVDGYDAYISSGEGVMPNNVPLKGWAGPYINAIPVDPWGNPYVFIDYSSNAANLSALISLGPDGIRDMNYSSAKPGPVGSKDKNPPDKTGFSIVYQNDNPANKNNFDVVLWME